MKDRIIEMLGRGERVELECVDEEAMIASNKSYADVLLSMQLIVSHIFTNKIVFNNGLFMRENKLKYFKIKEPEHTFNDLIDVAVRAYKDGYIRLMRLSNDLLDVSYNVDGDGLCGFLASKTEESGYQFDQYICDINSLYTETFVIESKEDMYRIGDEYEIVLSNGEDVSEMIIITENYPYTSYGDRLIPVSFEFLKGATVTQKRGN